ncbi:hypothetical protein OJAV_G00180230 [Oryzias javanicus]|uniref:Ig-like domain-containing protein n=1 Tax=Oryzias javanicus TaxID=123683 RepID=A0A3S2NZC4_ORYJA|nr:hypothetical protein OJAV_G00180230 [Oryzias javanicus]
MEQKLFYELLLILLITFTQSGQTQDAVLTVEPKWSTIYIGESLTFHCVMTEGRTDEWKYTLKENDWTLYSDANQPDFTLNPPNNEGSGVYQCCGRRKDSDYTKCSNTVSIHVSDRPRSRLTAGTTTVSVGDEVTLICSVEKSDGWKYEWFRRTSTISKYRINDGENGEIRVSQGGIYSCRGFRGEPVFYSDTSDEVNIYIIFSNKVIVKPSWSQIFIGEKFTLTCEVQGGEGVLLEYQWRTPQSQTSWRNYKDWTFTAFISGEYSCSSRPLNDLYYSTNWSEALRLSVLGKPKAQLIKRGETLICSVNPSSSGWSYYFYRGERINEMTEINTEFNSNAEFSVSQGGVYRCSGRRGSSYYTDLSDPIIIDAGKAKLTAGRTTVKVEDEVTLICSVDQSDGWKYEWFRRISTIPKYRINDGKNGEIRVSQGGIYSCRGFRGEPAFYSDTSDEVNIYITFSNKVIVTQKPSWSQMFRGETITLTCEVQGGEGFLWEYEWRTSQSQRFWRYDKYRTITASISGEYSCRSRLMNDLYSSTNWSEALRLSFSDRPRARLTAGTKIVAVGDRVTLICSVDQSDGWKYEWFRRTSTIPEYRINDEENGEIRVSPGGIYSCRGFRGEPAFYSDKSNEVNINLTQPVLRVSRWWLSPGSSVTLSCEVEHESAGWSFYWYKAVPDLSHKSASYSYELLPASSNGTADNSYIIHGQTHTAGYVCRAGRGEPHVYTLYSQPHFVWSGDLHPSASLSVSPDRVQHFTSDSVSLTCEETLLSGESAAFCFLTCCHSVLTGEQ